MKNVLFIFLISFIGLTFLSCSKKDDSSSSSSNIKLSDVKANLSGKSLFITTGDSSSSSSRSSRSSNKTSSTSTDSLITIDNNSVIDYGIISDYDLEIEQVRVDQNNEYAYLHMKYGGGHSDSNRDMNVRALNCTLFKINLSTNEMSCVEPGLVVTGIYHNMIYGVNDYHLDPFQFGSEHTFVFRTDWSVDFNAKNELKCTKSCIYEHNNQTGVTRRISPYGYEGERFLALGDGNMVWTGMKDWIDGTPLNPRSEIQLVDAEGNTSIFSSSPNNGYYGDFQGGEYKTVFWGSESQNTTVFARVVSGTVKKTFVSSENYAGLIVIKGDEGNI